MDHHDQQRSDQQNEQPTEAPLSVLVVDDDPILLQRVKASFGAHGMICFVAENEDQMHAALAHHAVDAILLDVVLNTEDGFSIMRKLREASNVPILMLTNRTQIEDRLEGLQGGADDYISKPFDMREVVARVQAVVRRKSGIPIEPSNNARLNVGRWHLDPDRHCLHDDTDKEINLSDRETELACIFFANPGRTYTREWLHRALYHRDWSPMDRSIDNLVARLRRRLDAAPDLKKNLVTERNVGYRFLSPDNSG